MWFWSLIFNFPFSIPTNIRSFCFFGEPKYPSFDE